MTDQTALIVDRSVEAETGTNSSDNLSTTMHSDSSSAALTALADIASKVLVHEEGGDNEDGFEEPMPPLGGKTVMIDTIDPKREGRQLQRKVTMANSSTGSTGSDDNDGISSSIPSDSEERSFGFGMEQSAGRARRSSSTAHASTNSNVSGGMSEAGSSLPSNSSDSGNSDDDNNDVVKKSGSGPILTGIIKNVKDNDDSSSSPKVVSGASDNSTMAVSTKSMDALLDEIDAQSRPTVIARGRKRKSRSNNDNDNAEPSSKKSNKKSNKKKNKKKPGRKRKSRSSDGENDNNDEQSVRPKPKRPMTAYNFFFRTERKKIVAMGLDAYNAMMDGIPPPPPRGECAAKVSFEEMGKAIGRRWKEIPKDDLLRYQILAKEESARYEREMKVYAAEEAAIKKNEGRAIVVPGSRGAKAPKVEADDSKSTTSAGGASTATNATNAITQTIMSLSQEQILQLLQMQQQQTAIQQLQQAAQRQQQQQQIHVLLAPVLPQVQALPVVAANPQIVPTRTGGFAVISPSGTVSPGSQPSVAPSVASAPVESQAQSIINAQSSQIMQLRAQIQLMSAQQQQQAQKQAQEQAQEQAQQQQLQLQQLQLQQASPQVQTTAHLHHHVGHIGHQIPTASALAKLLSNVSDPTTQSVVSATTVQQQNNNTNTSAATSRPILTAGMSSLSDNSSGGSDTSSGSSTSTNRILQALAMGQ